MTIAAAKPSYARAAVIPDSDRARSRKSATNPPAKTNMTPAIDLCGPISTYCSIVCTTSGWFVRSSLEGWEMIDTRMITRPARNATESE